MCVSCLVFPGDYCCCCFCLRLWFSLSVCLHHQSKTTNLCIPDFSLLPVLLYPLRFKSEPCVLSVSFFYSVYFCVAWTARHALSELHNPRLQQDIECVYVCILSHGTHFVYFYSPWMFLSDLASCNFLFAITGLCTSKNLQSSPQKTQIRAWISKAAIWSTSAEKLTQMSLSIWREGRGENLSAIGEFCEIDKLWKLWRNNHGNCCSFFMTALLFNRTYNITQSITYSRLRSVLAVLYVKLNIYISIYTCVYVCVCVSVSHTGGAGRHSLFVQ